MTTTIITIYIGLFCYFFIELFHSSFIAFHLCMMMTWWYLQLNLGLPMNYLYGIAWLAKSQFSVRKTNTVFFRMSSLGLVLANSSYRNLSARDCLLCCRGRGSHEKSGDMSNNDPSQPKYDCRTLFQTQSARCTYIKLSNPLPCNYVKCSTCSFTSPWLFSVALLAQ